MLSTVYILYHENNSIKDIFNSHVFNFFFQNSKREEVDLKTVLDR